MIRLFLILFAACLLAFGAFTANGQTECPQGMVCLTPEAARAALEAGDKAKALEAELKAKDEAIKVYKDDAEKLRIDFARVSGENTALKQNAVSDRAIIEVMLKMVRKKCAGLVFFC